MKTRITLILLMTLSLCSCLGGSSESNYEPEYEKKSGVQELSLVLSQLSLHGNMVLENGTYKIKELTKNELKEVWFDVKAYNDAKRLLKTYNKDLKEMLSKLENETGIKDYILHDATMQREFANKENKPAVAKHQNQTIQTYDKSPVMAEYEVENGATRQVFVCLNHALSESQGSFEDSIYILSAEIDGEMHVYVTIVPGPIYIDLPGVETTVKLAYMTSHPNGGTCIW